LVSMTAGKGHGRTVVGVDGGATRTRILLSGPDGIELGRTQGPGSLLGAGRDERIAEAIVAQVTRLAGEAGVSLPVDAFCAGLAGAAGRPEARRLCEDHMERSGITRLVRVISDADVAFADAFGDGKGGILIVSGSGSIGVARVEGVPADAPLLRVGGWGALLGDEGSGYGLGLAGLRAAIRGAENRGPATSLVEALSDAVGATSVRSLFDWANGVGKSGIAALAPVVVAEAARGDSVAETLVNQAVTDVVAHAVALQKRHFHSIEGPPVALVGGLIEAGGPLRGQVLEALKAEGFAALPAHVVPARGAVRLARGM